MERTDESVDDWLAANDPDGTLAALDQVILRALSGQERVMWRGVMWGGTEQAIVGYATIQQPRPRGRTVTWFLVGLARQKNYVSLYVNAVADGQYLSQTYAPQLGKVKVGAASISFKRLQDVDLEALGRLLRQAAETAEG